MINIIVISLTLVGALLLLLAGLGRIRNKVENIGETKDPAVTPFDAELTALGVKEAYHLRRAEYLKEHAAEAFPLSDRSFYQFIATSFLWECTPEGFKFWHTIALHR